MTIQQRKTLIMWILVILLLAMLAYIVWDHAQMHSPGDSARAITYYYNKYLVIVV